MKTQKTKPTPKRKTPPLAVVIFGALVLIALVWSGIALYGALNTKSTVNYAEEVAKPLEEALVKAGGVRKCSEGDAGRGSDNDKPWHHAYYELPSGRDRTITIVDDIATKNGYSLTHASPGNRGHLGAVADAYIENWYFDTTSKQSPYTDLQSGQIELAVGVNNDGPIELNKLSCKTDETVKVNSDANISAVNIQISLPRFVR